MVLATLWTDLQFVLLDSNKRRTEFLGEAVIELGLTGRVRVLCERAEVAGRMLLWRSSFDLVVARSFGRPAVTAECAAPFLRVGGVLAVTEPAYRSGEPDELVGSTSTVSDDRRAVTRWPAEGVRQFGLEGVSAVVEPVSIQLLRQAEACPDRFPRRTGIPSRRPMF